MGKIGVVADIHGNIKALESVLESAGSCDQWWCAGDIVGYGPYPNECCTRINEMGVLCVAGNHDLGSLGSISLGDFNDDARIACEWTARILDETSRNFLCSLSLDRKPSAESTVVHGSPLDPVWEYVVSRRSALRNFEHFDSRVCFHGHSHAAAVFSCDENGEIGLLLPKDGTEVKLEENRRYMVNVGSVGQPRDGDPRACYVVFRPEERTIKYHRVGYQVEEVQEKMESEGFPYFLVERLSRGI